MVPKIHSSVQSHVGVLSRHQERPILTKLSGTVLLIVETRPYYCLLEVTPTFRKNVLPPFPSVSCSYFLNLLVEPEDEGNIFVRNVGEILPSYAALHTKIYYYCS
jgi:hypothetical protein